MKKPWTEVKKGIIILSITSIIHYSHLPVSQNSDRPSHFIPVSRAPHRSTTNRVWADRAIFRAANSKRERHYYSARTIITFQEKRPGPERASKPATLVPSVHLANPSSQPRANHVPTRQFKIHPRPRPRPRPRPQPKKCPSTKHGTSQIIQAT